jgi:site-specific DNA-methyltransferase (adenine-specific)
MTENTLYYGDNLPIIREYIPDESVDLIYLDPPFNSNRSYNVLFRDEADQDSEAQITAFEDTWHWDQGTEQTYVELVTNGAESVSTMISSLRQFIGTNQMMAYLTMMAARLVELHRVLKTTGSLYLHCDTTASHYLKIVLDTIFDFHNFRNEISWKRSNPKSHITNNFPNCRDIILRYSKSDSCFFNAIYGEHDPEYVAKAYRYTDEKGKRYRLLPLLNPNDDRPNLTYEFLGITRVWRWTRDRMEKAYKEGVVVQLKPGSVPQYKKYLDTSKGRTITDDWGDIQQSAGNENLGYPTQKPLALLERIIQASSIPGDIVLDPFCGCGTAIAAAQKLDRRWIGIDITHLSIALIKYRLQDSFPGIQLTVKGEPTNVSAAHQLANDDRFQFEWWALSLVRARPSGGATGSKKGKKGKDKGVDGVISFIDEAKGKPKKVIVQVKSGKVSSRDIRDLVGTIEREEAPIGVFITLEPPTRDMTTEAASAGFYTSQMWDKSYPCIQVLTIEDLLDGRGIQMPPQHGTFKQAPIAKKDNAEQPGLGI